MEEPELAGSSSRSKVYLYVRIRSMMNQCQLTPIVCHDEDIAKILKVTRSCLVIKVKRKEQSLVVRISSTTMQIVPRNLVFSV